MNKINYAPILGALLTVTPTSPIISEKHLRAMCALTIEELDQKFGFRTIRTLADTLVGAAKEKGMTSAYNNEYGVDSDIFDWFPDGDVSEDAVPQGTVTMLKENTTEGTMRNKALKLCRSHAIEKMTELIQSEYFNQDLKWFVIYLTETKDGVPLELVCIRYDGGKFRTVVDKVDPDDVWYVDDGEQVGFLSNES